ncbi:MAG: MATE family efflux transporter [Treponema sp.]|jgi:putative MATE family efflux protein|nr:MATE family efflux transporter [Treponema sp.]
MKLFDDREFYRNLFAVALPIMLQNLVNAAVNMADTIMIGRLGTVEIAAVGIGNNVFFLYSIILFGVTSGGSIFTAQFWGRRDIAGIRRNTGFCLLLNIAAGILFTLAALLAPEGILRIYSRDPAVITSGGVYLKSLAPSFIPFAVSQVFFLTLRSIEEVRIPMIGTFTALGINVVFNYFLIFGAGPFPAMGVRGAAIATVMARAVETVFLIAISYGGKYALAGSLRELTAFNAVYVRRFFGICLPVIFNEIIWSLGVTVQNIIFARTGTDAIAAFNIVSTVSQLTWVLFIGLGNGVGVLIGKKIGSGDERGARDYAARIVRFAPALAVGAALVLVPVSRLLPLVFNAGQAVFSGAALMLIVLSVSYPFRAFNMSMVIGICRAGGDTVFCAFYDNFFMWCVALPAAMAAAFIFKLPVWAVYLCVSSEEFLKVILGLSRSRSGKWLHNVTTGI